MVTVFSVFKDVFFGCREFLSSHTYGYRALHYTQMFCFHWLSHVTGFPSCEGIMLELASRKCQWQILGISCNTYMQTTPDHPRSGVVYNFEDVCLPVCLYVYICLTTTFESLDVGSLFSLIWYPWNTRRIRTWRSVRAKFKLTGAKKDWKTYSLSLKVW